MTLLELLVVLALLGLVAVVALPSLVTPSARGATLVDAVRAARSAAVARGALLTLSVGADGAWEVRALPPGDSALVTGGTLAAPPGRPLVLQLTPLGACLPATPLPQELRGWDAAGCTAAAAGGATGGAAGAPVGGTSRGTTGGARRGSGA